VLLLERLGPGQLFTDRLPTIGGRSSPHSAVTRAAIVSDMRRMNELLSSESDCTGVVVTGRRGAVVDGSGQSKTSRSGLRAERIQVR